MPPVLKLHGRIRLGIVLFCAMVLFGVIRIRLEGAETFRVATYNLENYLDAPARTRHAKSAEAKAKVRESILALKPDVLALQEIGSASALQELRDSLKGEGLDLVNWEMVEGHDTNIHVAVLSRFPFTARRPHTNDNFLLAGRRFAVSRGFAEVDIQVNSNYSFTLITAHLKSKLPVGYADEVELRHEEAKLLREAVDQRFAASPEINLIVLGDLNDTRDSVSTRAVIGRGKHKLVDTRPAERNGDDLAPSKAGLEPRNITWTEYYAKEDTYSRIDYILLSPGMAREWVAKETYVLAMPNWGAGSDHRPLVAAFEAVDK
jgi:endonuclease/exonuclease/phosphatase family metal-dependent hydrolase